MYPELKNNNAWEPTASIETLRSRAKILRTIREFFYKRNVLEVETQLLSRFAVTDPFIEAIPAFIKNKEKYFLQTSPEYGMKRLLAHGSGSIYQIAKAFRDGESGRLHNPEFTMLEWYRVGFDHLQLMQEVDELLRTILNTAPANYISYQDLFIKYLNINPNLTTIKELQDCAVKVGININNNLELDKDDWLNLLLTHFIEPKLQGNSPWMIYDYPQSQAALAIISKDKIPLAQRFEVYYQGLELANGYHELLDPKEQLHRFTMDNNKRKTPMEIDYRLIQALEYGIPKCAGVALGVDRMVLLHTKSSNIKDVIAFPLEIA